MEKELIVTQELGLSLPTTDRHAVSVSLPLWEHVVGYEEGKKDIVMQMQCGYPRFRIHNAVQGLIALVKSIILLNLKENAPTSVEISGYTGGSPKKSTATIPNIWSMLTDCLIFPTRAIAERFRSFMNYHNTAPGMGSVQVQIYVLQIVDKYICLFPREAFAKAKKYWQHSGEILSSRQAEHAISYLLNYLRINGTAEDDLTPFQLISELPIHQNSSIIFVSWGEELTEHSSIITELPLTHVDPITIDRSNENEKVIKQRIVNIVNHNNPSDSIALSTSDINLTPSGMASLFTSLRIVQQCYCQEHPEVISQVVVFGFPYLDTLKIMARPEWNIGGVRFLGHGEGQDIAELAVLLESHQLSSTSDNKVFRNTVCAVFTEFPTNPMMKASDLIRLTELCTRYGVALIVDDTISNFANVNLLNSPSGVKVDLLCSSLTKIFSGASNVMAGSIIVNPHSTKYGLLSTTIQQMKQIDDLPPLSPLDAPILEYNSRSFLLRSNIINRNALALAKWLHAHPMVRNVRYLTIHDQGEVYNAVKRPSLPLQLIPTSNADSGDDLISSLSQLHGVDVATDGHEAGYGCLLAFELDASLHTMSFYDHLIVNKGPSLGTNFTLVCPYTLLAHYCELDWAASFGVPGHLIRVSVGLEAPEELIRIFEVALHAAEIPVE